MIGSASELVMYLAGLVGFELLILLRSEAVNSLVTNRCASGEREGGKNDGRNNQKCSEEPLLSLLSLNDCLIVNIPAWSIRPAYGAA
jgi:hypothetical protein